MSISPLGVAKEEASRVIARLQELGVTIKRTQAYEAIAAAHNYPDWNRYRAHLRSTAVGSMLQPMEPLMARDISDDFDESRGAMESQDAVANRYVINTRAGSGKTTTLSVLFGEALATGAGVPVYINCSGVEKAQQRMMAPGVQMVHLHVSEGGELSGWPTFDVIPKGLLILLDWTGNHPLMSANDASRRRASGVMWDLLNQLADTWPGDALPISQLLIDEVHRVDHDDVPWLRPLDLPALRRAEVVAAHQCASELWLMAGFLCVTTQLDAEILWKYRRDVHWTRSWLQLIDTATDVTIPGLGEVGLPKAVAKLVYARKRGIDIPCMSTDSARVKRLETAIDAYAQEAREKRMNGKLAAG